MSRIGGNSSDASETRSLWARTGKGETRLPSRKRRRRLRVAVAVLIALAVLIWTGPYLASTSPATRLIVSAVNGRIRGRISVGDLSLRWLGPCGVEGLVVADPQGRQVLRAERIVWSKGIWGAGISPEHLERIDVEAPRAVLYVDEDGTISLAQAFELREKRPKEPRERPKLTGQVVLRQAQVQIIRPGGRTVNVTAINGQVDLRTLDDLAGKFEFAVAGGADEAGAEPVEATLDWKLVTTAEKLTCEVDLNSAGEAVSLLARLEYPTGGRAVLPSGEQILAAALTGKPVELPDFAADVDLSADLPALARAGLLTVRAGVHVTGGKIAVTNVRLRGGATPSAKGSLVLTGLTAERAGQRFGLSPISVEFDAWLAEGEGLTIRRAAVKSDFARLDVSGTARKLEADFRADLAALHRQMGQVFDLGAFKLAGEVKGKLALVRRDEQRVDVALTAGVQGLQYAASPRRLDVEALDLRANGRIDLDGREVAGLTLSEGHVEIDGEPAAHASGRYDFRRKSLQAEVALDRADIAAVLERAKGFGLGDAPPLTGTVTMKAEFDRGGPGQALVSTGGVAATGLAVNGTPLASERATLTWTGASLLPEGRGVTVRLIRAVSGAGTAGVTDLAAQRGKDWRISGKAELDADLAAVWPDLARALGRGGRGKAPERVRLSGRLGWSGRFTAANEVVSVAGDGRVNDLEVAAETIVFGEDKVTFAHDVAVDTRAEKIALRKVEVSAGQVKLTVAGSVSDYLTTRQADLRGRYAGPWRDILARVSEHVPDIAGKLALDGRAVGEYRLAGPLIAEHLRPPYRALAASLDIGWPSGRAFGLSLGETRLSVSLREGKVHLPTSMIPSSGGRLQVGAVVDFTKWDSTAGGSAEDLRADATIQLDADLAKLSADVPDLFGARSAADGKTAQPPLFGRLSWGARLTAADRTVSLVGSGSVDELKVGAGKRAFREPALRFSHEVAVDTRAWKIAIRKMDVSCGLVTLNASGTVRNVLTTRDAELRGRYSGSWADIMKRLYELAPGAADKIALSGEAAGEFQLVGSLASERLQPPYRHLAGTVELGWASGQVFGLSMGKAKLTLLLRDGKVHPLGAETIALSQGLLRPGGVVDLGPRVPTFRLLRHTTILEDVEITREMGERLLSRFNPIFASLASVEGKAGLVLDSLRVPLSGDASRQMTGKGRLDLSKLRAQPEGLLKDLLALGGLGPGGLQPLTVRGVDFRVHDGRIHYDNLTVNLGAGFEVIFRGSVGFDETLDLVVSVPIRAPLLERLKVRGPVTQYARILEGLRVEIPILGTRLRPRLGMAKVDVASLIRRAVELLLAERAAEVLRDGLGGRSRQPATQPRRERRGGDLIEDILDILLPKEGAPRRRGS